MTNQILIKRSAVASKVPATTDLALGELAINTYDGKLYLKKTVSGTDTVVQIGSANTTSAATPPASPNVGDEWYDTVNGALYRYTFDGTTNYWLDITGPTSTAQSVSNTVISGGSVDNTIIGGITPAAGTFTSIVVGAAVTPIAKFTLVDDTNSGWSYTQYNSSEGTNFRNQRARGTIVAPTAVQVNDRLASFLGAGHTGTGFSGQNGGISVFAAENFTATGAGTYLTLGTSAIGTNPASGGPERMRIDSSGNITFQATGAALNNVSSVNGGQLAGLRNRVINGNFDVWQRGTSFTGTAFSYYGPDRWQCFRSGGVAGATFSRSNNFDSNATYYLKAQRDSANATANSILVTTTFETLENYKLLGKQITLSFKLLKGADLTGVVMAQVVYGTGADGNLATGFTSQGIVCTTNISPTTGLTQYSITGTPPTNATQIGITFTYTPTGTAGANDWFGVTGVQLEIGAVATPFEFRSYGMELAFCRRYARALDIGALFVCSNTTTGSISYVFDTPMRAPPTFNAVAGTTTVFTGGNISTTSTPSIGATTIGGITLNVGGFTGLPTNGAGIIVATPGSIISAEL